MDPKVQELEDRIKKLENLLFTNANDTRFQGKVRAQVVEVRASTGKPVIVSTNGKKWQVDTVTELN